MRGAESKTTQRARSLRQSDNDAEVKLWAELRYRRLNGFKFVRQFPIGPYFADFVCRERSLVIEIDGSQHAENERDAIRDKFMTAEGWSVARFWNVDVLTVMPSVLETIVTICEGRLTEAVVARDFKFRPAMPPKWPLTPTLSTRAGRGSLSNLESQPYQHIQTDPLSP